MVQDRMDWEIIYLCIHFRGEYKREPKPLFSFRKGIKGLGMKERFPDPPKNITSSMTIRIFTIVRNKTPFLSILCRRESCYSSLLRYQSCSLYSFESPFLIRSASNAFRFSLLLWSIETGFLFPFASLRCAINVSSLPSFLSFVLSFGISFFLPLSLTSFVSLRCSFLHCALRSLHLELVSV